MFNVGWPRFLSRSASTAAPHDVAPIAIASVPIHRIETKTDKTSRTLKHLLKANHANYSVIWNNLRFHNHTPHILGSAYLLGANSDQLHDLYNEETRHLDPWRDSPGEVSKEDWRDYWGKRNYQRAFLDFFEDELVKYGYDWQQLLRDFLYEGEGQVKGPLINNLTTAIAHPLIHLGYALELNNRALAMESLTAAAGFYNDRGKYLDDPRYTRPPPKDTPQMTPLELLRKAGEDTRFDGLFKDKGGNNDNVVFEKKEDELLEYWNAWQLQPDPTQQFEHSQRAAVALLVATHDRFRYDFYFCHLLTSSHAVRIILPLIDERWHKNLVRQWWLYTVAVYIAQVRPAIDESRISGFKLDGKDWDWVAGQCLTSKWRYDAHYVKALRAMKVAAETWGDKDQYYLKAAVKFASTFTGWGGFANEGIEARSERGEY